MSFNFPAPLPNEPDTEVGSGGSRSGMEALGKKNIPLPLARIEQRYPSSHTFPANLHKLQPSLTIKSYQSRKQDVIL
jgi:hypothetical protein